MQLPENWDLQIDPDALKSLEKIPRNSAGALLRVIKLLPGNPYFGDIRKMKGEENTWCRRIGAYRVFYKIKVAEKILLVFRIERRTSKIY